MKNSPIHTTSSVTEYNLYSTLYSTAPPAQSITACVSVLLLDCASTLSIANVYYAQHG
ncbi:hypothetical protein [Pectobacterium zantedeschiae]|uniref:hypothetical protein n=1 Tax=Pectobacterium zantedeschiae TaxID=2034769 RepID=UPI003BF596F9